MNRALLFDSVACAVCSVASLSDMFVGPDSTRYYSFDSFDALVRVLEYEEGNLFLGFHVDLQQLRAKYVQQSSGFGCSIQIVPHDHAFGGPVLRDNARAHL